MTLFIKFSSHLRYLVIFFITVLMFACTNRSKLIYFQGELKNSGSNKSYNPILKEDDILSITILGLEAEAIKPFNIPSQQIGSNVGGYITGAPTPNGYLIDADGYIDFPVVGKIKLAGLSRSAAIDSIKKHLNPYLSQPTILMRILNYKVTVLGEVKNPGTFTIPNERITILEAIGIAGDLLITGIRKDVYVIRDVNGKKTETKVDLTSKELFDSPVYYLSQNDVVYVQPNRAKINSSVVNTSNVSLIISIISLFVTMGFLFTR